jgi:hypothetical protein
MSKPRIRTATKILLKVTKKPLTDRHHQKQSILTALNIKHLIADPFTIGSHKQKPSKPHLTKRISQQTDQTKTIPLVDFRRW